MLLYFTACGGEKQITPTGENTEAITTNSTESTNCLIDGTQNNTLGTNEDAASSTQNTIVGDMA